MFSFFPTFVAILACLIGLDMALTDQAPPLGWTAFAVLAVIPAGELSIICAKRNGKKNQKVRLSLWPLALGLLPPVGYAAACLLGGLPRVVIALGIDQWVLVDELLLLALYPLTAALGRSYLHRRARVFDRARTWKRCRTEMLLGFRGELALMAPIVLLILVGDLIALSDEIEKAIADSPPLLYSLALACVLILAFSYPFMLKILWRMKQLGAIFGPTPELLAFVKQLNFRFRDLLAWNTGGLIVNAALLGVVPRWRYILLTDSMIERFTMDELKATIAHEIGHGKKHHSLLFIALSVGYVAALGLVDRHLSLFETTGDELLAAALFYLPATIIYVVGLIGFVSRRFEVEADIFAVRAVGNSKLFVQTLERLAAWNRHARSRKSWRHFSLDRRIELMESFFPGENASASVALVRFEKRLKMLKIILLATSILLGASFLYELVRAAAELSA